MPFSFTMLSPGHAGPLLTEPCSALPALICPAQPSLAAPSRAKPALLVLALPALSLLCSTTPCLTRPRHARPALKTTFVTSETATTSVPLLLPVELRQVPSESYTSHQLVRIPPMLEPGMPPVSARCSRR